MIGRSIVIKTKRLVGKKKKKITSSLRDINSFMSKMDGQNYKYFYIFLNFFLHIVIVLSNSSFFNSFINFQQKNYLLTFSLSFSYLLRI